MAGKSNNTQDTKEIKKFKKIIELNNSIYKKYCGVWSKLQDIGALQYKQVKLMQSLEITRKRLLEALESSKR